MFFPIWVTNWLDHLWIVCCFSTHLWCYPYHRTNIQTCLSLFLDSPLCSINLLRHHSQLTFLNMSLYTCFPTSFFKNVLAMFDPLHYSVNLEIMSTYSWCYSRFQAILTNWNIVCSHYGIFIIIQNWKDPKSHGLFLCSYKSEKCLM